MTRIKAKGILAAAGFLFMLLILFLFGARLINWQKTPKVRFAEMAVRLDPYRHQIEKCLQSQISSHKCGDISKRLSEIKDDEREYYLTNAMVLIGIDYRNKSLLMYSASIEGEKVVWSCYGYPVKRVHKQCAISMFDEKTKDK